MTNIPLSRESIGNVPAVNFYTRIYKSNGSCHTTWMTRSFWSSKIQRFRNSEVPLRIASLSYRREFCSVEFISRCC
jgi:hypothetical protein